MWMAAPGRICEPRLVLPARDPNGNRPRLRAEHGRERALDGCHLRFPITDHTPFRYHHLH
jgi:hypothetical protein